MNDLDISCIEIKKQTENNPYVVSMVHHHSINVFYSNTIVSNHSRQKILEATKTITVPPNQNKVKKFIDPDLCIIQEFVTRDWWNSERKKVKVSVPKWNWVPSEFTIDTKTKRVKKISHIEHLEPQKDGKVYSAISAVFNDMWPMLERVLKINTNSENIVLPVIVKVQSYAMPPLAEYEGFWHQENVTDAIAAVGLYYYEFDSNLSEGRLDVRPSQVIYAAFSEDGRVYKCNEDDGHVPVKEGTAIVFDNKEVVHKFAKVKNNNTQIDANRSFISFFYCRI